MPGEAFRAIARASTMPTFAYFNNFAPVNVAGSVEALVVVVEVDVVVFFYWALAEMTGSDRHGARAVRQTRRVFMLVDLSYSKMYPVSLKFQWRRRVRIYRIWEEVRFSRLGRGCTGQVKGYLALKWLWTCRLQYAAEERGERRQPGDALD